MTRKEKKAEEKRILAEMQAALDEADGVSREQTEKKATPPKKRRNDLTPEVVHCRRCRTVMENGVCPSCGFRMYVPMDKEKQDKIKFTLTCVLMAVFVVVFVITQIIKN